MELGVVEVDEWRFRGLRCENDLISGYNILDGHPVDWLTAPHRQGPLGRATFVCRSWYDVGVRLLYEHVNIGGSADLRRFTRAMGINPRLREFVRTFTHFQAANHLIYAPNIKLLKKRLLSSTEWRITIDATGQDKIEPSLFTQMSNLTEFHLIGSPSSYWHSLKRFQSVRTLTMEGIFDSYTGSGFQPVINDVFPNVEVFRFFSGRVLLYPYHRGSPMDTSHMHMPHLRELEVIDVDLIKLGVELVQGMLETNAGTLEKLVVVGNTSGDPTKNRVTDAAMRQFLPALNMDVCPFLKDVTIGHLSIDVPFQDVVPGLVFPTAMERLEIRGSVFPWPDKEHGTMGLRIFYDADREFRPYGRQHFTKMPNLKEIVVYEKRCVLEQKYHPGLYDACVDDDVSLKLYWVDRKCPFCNSEGRSCDDWLHWDTPDGKETQYGSPRPPELLYTYQDWFT